LFKKAGWLAGGNWGYLLATIPFFAIYYFWHKRGRDKRYISENVYFKPDNVETKTVSLFSRPNLPLIYHPIDGLTPSEVGTIIDERVQTHDLIAEVVELARLGFLEIQKIDKKEYAFIKKKEVSEGKKKGLKSYQIKILVELFKPEYIEKSKEKLKKLKKKKDTKIDKNCEFTLLSCLKNEFYTVLSEIKKDLYEKMKEEGFFAGNPEKTRVKWLILYFVIIGVFASLVVWFASITANPFPVIILIPLSFVGSIFAWFMPRRTPRGYSLYMQTKGLKEYLKKGKWRYEHMEKKLFFEEILPLAISLQVVNQLTKDMKELDVKPPDYFKGTTVSTFNIYFNDFYSNSSKGLTSAPGSSSSSWSGGSGFSGGGSVGGGFGGGGGGSW
jgi:uncharacterized membrane protein